MNAFLTKKRCCTKILAKINGYVKIYSVFIFSDRTNSSEKNLRQYSSARVPKNENQKICVSNQDSLENCK